MIVNINKVISFTANFEVKKSGNGFVISMSNDSEFKCMSVTREELELISKAIMEELKKAEG